MTDGLQLTWYAAFSAGLLSSLSPCVYPMIPISLAYLARTSNGNQRRGALIFFAGQVVTLTGLGLLAAKLGEVFGFSSEFRWVNALTGILLLGLGFLSWKGESWGLLARMNQGLQRRLPQGGFAGAFTFGAASAIVASPCTSPALGAVLVGVASQPGSWSAISLMFSFATGLGLIFLVAGIGLGRISKVPRAGKWMQRIHNLMTTLVFGAAFYYLFRSL